METPCIHIGWVGPCLVLAPIHSLSLFVHLQVSQEYFESVVYLADLVCFSLYYILMDHYFGGTLGKLGLNLRVITKDRRYPTWWQAVSRNLGKIVSGLPLGYGFLVILAPHRNQTFHDQLGNCFVVRIVTDNGQSMKESAQGYS